MKAAVLEKIDAPLAVRDVELTELKIGQVLVKVLVSGLCGAQLHEIRGHKGNGKFLPHLMGHEGCGIVKEVGPGVTTVKEGDKVVMHWRPWLRNRIRVFQNIIWVRKYIKWKVYNTK